MHKRLIAAIDRLNHLPEERQEAAAVLLLDFLETDQDIELTAGQLSEIEQRLATDEVVSDKEAQAFFTHMKA